MAALKTALALAFLMALSSQHIAAMCPSCPKECCFEFHSGNPLRATSVASYYRTDPECNREAVVFVMKSTKRICVSPEARWVRRLLPKLQEMK
ncbi:C-C motif chemokine 5-like [Anolis carolinensis]|uniref:C-C motif chemokine 5-like n=1 Tax=Anolis carolinensis TaxID=28377 RepID=UPI002F2B58EF